MDEPDGFREFVGRLMGEVTAQPLVDVDFDAVASRVRRRRGVLAVSAGTAGLVLVAAAVAIPLSRQGHRSAALPGPVTSSVGPTPSAAVLVDPSWRQSSWNDISWRMPASWHTTGDSRRDAALAVEKGPAGEGSPGPYLSDIAVASSCSAGLPHPGCQLVNIIKTLPADGIVGDLSEQYQLTAAEHPGTTEDPGSVSAPDPTCTAWGGAETFTAQREFGTAPFVHTVVLWACLGSAQVATAPAQLRTLVATLADAGAATVDPSWRTVRTGRLSLRLPPDWTLGDAGTSSAGHRLDGLCQPAAALGTAVSCPPAAGIHVAEPDLYAWISALSPGSNDASSGNGINVTQAQCAHTGDVSSNTLQRHLGPQTSGEVLTIDYCYGSATPAKTSDELTLILDSVVDTAYPDPAQLCSSVPGTVESEAFETVGALRALRWGNRNDLAADLFPGAASSDFAAWCWVRDNPHQRFDVWAAHADDAAVKVVSVGFPEFEWGPAPSMPPVSLMASAGITLGPSPTP